MKICFFELVDVGARSHPPKGTIFAPPKVVRNTQYKRTKKCVS
jgi:hypothetical protein